MSERKLVAEELSNLFNALSHPDRIRILEELRNQERDVHSLSDSLGLSSSRVSQHLSLLKNLRMVQERRDGKHHFYSLIEKDLASWILEGVRFTASGVVESRSFDKAVKKALSVWDPK
jgi:DNA-binding transcriptional ArsR family regulator